MGIIATAMSANRVFAQWYVRRANICAVNIGNAMPIRFRKRLCPASADDAHGP